jgi:hypothetical protein
MIDFGKLDNAETQAVLGAIAEALSGVANTVDDRICALIFLLAHELAKTDEPQKMAAEWCAALLDGVAFVMAKQGRAPLPTRAEH